MNIAIAAGHSASHQPGKGNLSPRPPVVRNVTASPPTPFDSQDWWDPDGFLFGLHALLDPVRIPYFTATLDRRVRPGGRILDVGCGGGFVSYALTAAGYEVVGVDLSTRAVHAARLAAAGWFAAASGERLPFASDTFDAVICSEVLEHVDSPGQVLSEVARTMKPGATLLFSTPNRTWLSRLVLIDLAQRWRPTSVLPPGLHEWSRLIRPDEMRQMMSVRGLHVDEMRGLTISTAAIARGVRALVRLKRHRIGYARAGEQIRLRTGANTALAYLGAATMTRFSPETGQPAKP